ncbi:YihY/virulence factor BrkB family protein [Maritimibacter sp. UBA3975]|uniref:YihY/virulence factor BrkB family protein n=1 Tax=Maritimibacter sp. UBA3975 TaxID=1946833 RepID=UPI000C0BA520|nr:YihY/virulence factor BrkB family protein [Maritimibacter sp. UBA3975]MAM63572.1 ribonuclease BN [Maritimibacter sp.]
MAEATHVHSSTRTFDWGERRAIAVRVFKRIQEDRISLTAAGVAFFGLLALFPAITAIIAIGGLFFAPAEITGPIDRFSDVLPDGAASIITDQATSVAGSQDGGLGLAALLGLLLAIYSASKGVTNLVAGLNVAYAEREQRGFIRERLTVLSLTAFLVIGVVVALGVVLVFPAIMNLLPLGEVGKTIALAGQWAALFVLTIGAFSVLYRFGPDRAKARWSYVLPGTLVACVMWIVASAGFAIYVENFGSYQESFGALAGAIVLLLWLWLSAFVVLIGAELNAEIEAQRHRDTTAGESQPLGERGAVKADTYAGSD